MGDRVVWVGGRVRSGWDVGVGDRVRSSQGVRGVISHMTFYIQVIPSLTHRT